MSYSINFRRKVIFTMEEEGLSIAKRLNFDYKIYVFIQYKFTDIE
ncbi:hypothetical protein [Arsenophonus endosymbiont of Bemisia tabaci]|nr:hypothetical protein [Arsenophonus endosymbiont of Bemisia tabaci]CAA2928998.1 hypothetical protein ARSQ2_00059 [Arsenophonus endosymbiont of Bemisia tabaci Q2]